MSVASEITRLQNAKASLKASIENKGVTVPSNATIDSYDDYVDSIQTSSSVVNGIIEQYKAETSTIDANTFVEFTNKFPITAGTDTQLNTETYSASGANMVSAVALSDDKVFIAHRYSSSLYGIVCTISNNTITAGTDTQLSSYSDSYEYVSATALSSDKVFVAHRSGGSSSSTNNRLKGIVCTINGTSISKGSDTQLTTSSNSYEHTSVVALSNDKVFVAHRNGSYLYGLICTINGTVITIGGDTQLSYNNYSYNYASATVLNNDKVFVAFGYYDGSDYYLGGVVCTINGTTITTGTSTKLSSITNAYLFASATTLSNNKVFIVYYNATLSSVYGIVCTINNTTITAGTDTLLVEDSNSGRGLSTNFLGNNQVFVSHGNPSDYLYGVVCVIKGTTINKGTDTQLSTVTGTSYGGKVAVLSNNKVFIAHSSGGNTHYLNGIVCSTGANTIQASTTRIDGLTKNECTTSTAGDVWVLNS